MTEPVRRAVVVGSAAVFRKRAGNAAYLASFCRALRQLGFTVELLFLDKIPTRSVYLDLHSDYLESVDAAAIHGSVRVGSRFLSRNPRAWLHKALGLARRRAFTRQARPSGIWNLPWPNDEALKWASGRISELQAELVVANYFNASPIFRRIDTGGCKAILIHDVFALRQKSYEAGGYPLDFAKEMVAAEAQGLAAADVCLAITSEEADFIRRLHPHVRTAIFPYVADFVKQEPTERCGKQVVFVASDNHPNRSALAWLLHEVWPRVSNQDPQARLRVVGSVWTGDDLPRPPGVEFAGVVDDLGREYGTASAALVPLRAGSGLKVKLIEALANGVPVISTSAGAAGVPPRSRRFLRVRDDPMEFADALVDILAAPDWNAVSAEALDFARANYSRAAAMRALREVFGAEPT